MSQSTFVVTTHLPSVGMYFVRRLAEGGRLEGVIVQQDRRAQGIAGRLKTAWRDFRHRLGGGPAELPILERELPGFDRWCLADGESAGRLGGLAERHGFSLIFTPQINEDLEVRRWLGEARSPWALVLGGRVLGRDVLETFRGGWMNGHGGILPDYRGLWSEYWALVNGQPDKIGCTIHQLTARVDRGAVIGRSTLMPDRDESLASLRTRNQALLVRTYLAVVEQLAHGELDLRYAADSDSGQGSYYSAPKRPRSLQRMRVRELCPHWQ